MATKRVFVAVFKTEGQIMEAVKICRAKGLDVDDCYTPYAVHGLDVAMGIKHTRLGWLAFFAGLTGFLTATTLEVWTSAYSWAVNVGGKPFISLPAFIPIMFELTVLFTGVITTIGFFVHSNLKPFAHLPGFERFRATNDQFVLALNTGGSFNESDAKSFLSQQGAVECAWYEN